MSRSTHAAQARDAANIVIGGAAGAFPHDRWAAATGTVGLESVLLFLIIFLDAAAFLGAVAVAHRGLCRAGIPMLRWSPVMRKRGARSSLFAGAGPLGASPWLFGYAADLRRDRHHGGVVMVWLRQIKTWACGHGRPRRQAAVRVSILYLFALFAVLLIDDGWVLPAAACCERDGAMDDNEQGLCSPTSRSAAAAPARSPSRSRSSRWCCCSMRSNHQAQPSRLVAML